MTQQASLDKLEKDGVFFSRPMPHSEEAERVTLGAIVMNNDLMNAALETVTEEHFHNSMNRAVFGAMRNLYDRGEPLEPVLILEELKALNKPIGAGVAYFQSMTLGVPHFTRIEPYLKTLDEKLKRRQFVKACSDAAVSGLDEEKPFTDSLDQTEQRLFEIRRGRDESKPALLGDLVVKSFNDVSEMAKTGGGQMLGLSTGFADVDRIMAGLQKTDLIILAARPSMGKTSCALDIARNAAKTGAAVGVFSLEMSKEQLTTRMICAEAKINSTEYRLGRLSHDEWGKAAEAARVLHDLKIVIDDSPHLSPIEMKAKARRIMTEQKGLDLIIVDYLSLMHSSKRCENRLQEVSAIARELKALAKTLDVPLLALSQLSRAPEARNPPKPLMSDLRESGEIEQAADVVAFLYREEYYKPTEENAGVAEILISKNRNGATGTAKLAFLKEFSTFENYYGGY